MAGLESEAARERPVGDEIDDRFDTKERGNAADEANWGG